MRIIKSLRPRSRLLGSAVVVAALTVGVIAIASAGPATRSASAQTPSCAAGTTVQTTSGPVCGIASTSVSGVNEWLGIPYAAPPVGNRRWQPPEAPTPWTTTLQATQFGSECTTTSGTAGSEDCLFVNVWAPANATASSNLPVMVHIHGGGFTAGNGNSDNSLLANTGEVIVSMNYRLNIFGFLVNDRALGANSGDYGLQDQQAALRWVQHNVAAFGGNPSKVTTFGESAGGSSQCDLIASPTAAGLFEQAISVSGEYNTLFGYPTSLEPQDCKSTPPTKAQANAAGRNFAAAAGCGTGSGAAVAACLRALPAAKVELIAGGGATPPHPGGYLNGGEGTVGPTINGTTLTMSLRQALKTGHVNHVRVIAGTDRDEDLVSYANEAPFPVTTPAAYTTLVDTQYGRFASQVLARYPVTRFDSPGVAWRTVAADSDTVCPSLVTDQDLANRMPTYAYEIDDNEIPPYLAAGPGVVAPGASHVGAWFLNPVTPALDANQQVLQNQEIAYVTTFARTGVPTPNGAPAWPRFNLANPREISLQPAGDTEVVTAAEVSAQHNCAFWDRIAPTP